MKFHLFLVIFSVSISTFAEEKCEIQPILNAEIDLNKINCHLESKLRKPNQAFCKNCHIKESILNPSFMQDKAIKEADLALIKTIVQPLSDTFKIGNNKDLNFSKCSYETLEEKIKKNPNCKVDANKLLVTFKGKLAKEMAIFVSTHASSGEGGFFKRAIMQNSCNISDADVLRIKTQDLERNINLDSLKDLYSIANNATSSVEIISRSYSSLNENTKSLITHPILRNILLSEPQKLADYITKNPKANNKDIVKWLYSKENISSLSDRTSKLCEDSFNQISTLLCSESFETGNLAISSFSDFEQDIPKDYKSHTTALYCSQFQNSAANITSILKDGLKENQLNIASLNKKDFENSFHKDEISSSKEKLCTSVISPCSDKKSPKCLLAEDVKEATQKNVSSFDKETIKKLRNFLGSDVQADDITKKTLIASGLMTEKDFSQTPPTPQVSSTPSPMAPEKERELFGKVIKPVTQPIAQNFSGANFNTVPSYNTNSSYNESVQEEVREKYREKSPVLPPSTAAYLKEMSSMNRDLLDRLVKERGAKDKYSMDEIKDQLAKLSKERELPLPLDQQAQFFDHEWSENAPKVMPYIPEDLKKDKSGRTIASIDTPVTGKALQDKKYQDQRNRALEQFGKGEVSNNNSTSDGTTIVMSVNNEAALKKVRLDVPTDKIEKLNLSSILGQKLVSDKEGEKLQQLIQNKQSFLLDIEGKVAFMVEYSDSKKGFDLKTLKNSLPVEVFEKIKTQISQFLSSNERKHEYQALKQELKVQ